eukprot:4252250-Pyramimonas_sp.AAC.1
MSQRRRRSLLRYALEDGYARTHVVGQGVIPRRPRRSIRVAVFCASFQLTQPCRECPQSSTPHIHCESAGSAVALHMREDLAPISMDAEDGICRA